MTKYLLTLFAIVTTIKLPAQTGGNSIWAFLNTPVSARATALGGQQIATFDNDITMIHFNPSLLNSEMHNHVSLSYANYLADIRYDYVNYARTFKDIGNFALGINHIDYGKFTAADEFGNITGSFNRVYDYSINAYYSRPVFDSMLYVGGTLKAIGSNYEQWNAFGLAMDAGVTYHSFKKQFTAALVIKNVGGHIEPYYAGAERERLPFEVQLGLSQKLQHAPFRFSVLFRNLETPDLTYETEEDKKKNIDAFTGEPIQQNKFNAFTDNLMRHTVLGLELLPMKNFSFRLGYNYRRREELKIANRMGTVGLTWGFGVKIYKFHINYSRARYHLAAVTNHFTLSVNLNEFGNKF